MSLARSCALSSESSVGRGKSNSAVPGLETLEALCHLVFTGPSALEAETVIIAPAPAAPRGALGWAQSSSTAQCRLAAVIRWLEGH